MSSSFVIPFLKLYKLWDQKAATVSHQPVVDWTQGEIVATTQCRQAVSTGDLYADYQKFDLLGHNAIGPPVFDISSA